MNAWRTQAGGTQPATVAKTCHRYWTRNDEKVAGTTWRHTVAETSVFRPSQRPSHLT